MPSEPTPPEVTDAGAASGKLVDRRSPYRPANVPLWNNVITIGGMFLAMVSVLLLFTFALFHIVTKGQNPYVDIVGFLIIPGLLVLGLITMPLGIMFKSWRIRRHDPTQRIVFRFPKIDLADPVQRRVAKAFGAGTFVFLPVLGVSSYQGYHYTDSTEFCSLACHSVMEPQATTYARSPHARVVCAECHIGEGVGWFVKAKLSGTRQVLAMMRQSFSRPIPPAIHHLRPARETCEHCHWPDKFYGAQLKEIPRFAADETNTDRSVTMLLKIGGGNYDAGPVEGIHWHMALANSIEYVATDDKLLVIPWIRIKDRLGKEHVYRSDGRPSSDPPPEGQLRTLDCIDCHNRPAHNFLSPQTSVDRMLYSGRIDRDLPFIKREAVRLLAESYPDRATAEEAIGKELAAFYQENYPEVWSESQVAVFQAIDTLREIHRTNVFPFMKVDWRTYPDNIGHLISPGCFRCHDDRHVNENGRVLPTDCDLCHTFLNHETRPGGGTALTQGEFIHPLELTGVHAAIRCDQCHDGGVRALPTCVGCHSEVADFIAGVTPEFTMFGIKADPMAGAVDCTACHDVSAPINLESMNESCLDCHDDDEDRFDGMVASWKKEVGELLTNANGDADLLDALHRAGALHNMDATRAILKSHRGTAEASPSNTGGN